MENNLENVRKIGIAFGMIMLAVLALMAYHLWSSHAEAIRGAETNSRNYAAIIKTQFDTTFRRAEAHVLELATDLPLEALNKSAVAHYAPTINAGLDLRRLHFPELVGLRIFDTHGDLIYTSESATTLRANAADRDYFRASRDNMGNGVFYSAAVVSRITGQPAMFIARVLRDKQGVFRGVASASVDLSYFQTLFQSLDVGTLGAISVFRSDDFTPVVRWPIIKNTTNSAPSPGNPTREAVAAGKKSGTFEFISNMDGNRRIYSFYALERYPFYVSVGIARDDALADWKLRSLIVSAAGLLVLALLSVLLFHLARAESRRTQAVIATQTNEMQLNGILESTADGILAVDGKGKVIRTNARFADLWRIPKTLMDSNDDQALMKFVVDQLNEPGAFVSKVLALYETRATSTDILTFKDGRVFERHSSPLLLKGKNLGRVWSFRDITERRKSEATRVSLEAQLRESQKMQAIGTLAGGIAHDFNNIISIILGNANLARRDVIRIPNAIECLEQIEMASVRARKLIHQILAFSRRQLPARKPIYLSTVVEDTVGLLRATLPARIFLDAQCAPNTPPVLADATLIQQVLINIITNAAQAIPKEAEGRISIRFDGAMLDAEELKSHPALAAVGAKSVGQAGQVVRLSITDNGPGMNAATQERIFEPFFTTKSPDEGTGLGLSVVHGIMQGHDGAIVVDSQPGHGTTFHLYFPATASPPDASTTGLNGAKRPTPAEPDSHPHVLYIDDDTQVLSTVQRLLEARGCRVSAFADPVAALAALRAAPASFNVVLTDYNMPSLSGLDVARAVSAIRADLPVAVTSGFIDENLQSLAAEAGVRELIFKADSVDTINDTVRRLTRPHQDRATTA